MTDTLKVEKPKLHLRLPIQYFSDSTHPFAAEPVAAEPHPLAAEVTPSKFAQYTDVPNPLNEPVETLQEGLQSQDQGAQGGQAADELQGQVQSEAQKQIEKLNFGGREIPVVDPSLVDLHKDYTELTRTLTGTQQEKTQLMQLNQQISQELEAFKQSQQSQQEQQTNQASAITPEREKEINDEYMERMYENKLAADQWLESLPEVQAQRQQRLQEEVNRLVAEQLAPITAREEQLKAQESFQQQITSVRETHSDFEQFAPQIQEILNDRPELADLPNALETMYWMAKGKASQTIPTTESLLSDPNFQQQILSNEQLKGQFLQQYQETIRTQNKQLPNMMGNGAGTQTPMSAGARAPRSIKEASILAAEHFRQG